MKKTITPTILMLCSTLVFAGNPPTTASPDSSISVNQTRLTDKGKVISRLEQVGYSKEEAIARADKMTGDEIVYFAGHPESIKRSGFIILASLIGSSVYSSIEHGQKKKAAELQAKRDQIAALERDVDRKQREQDLDMRLLDKEQDSDKRQNLKVAIDRLGEEIKSLDDNIRVLDDEIKAAAPKKK